MKLSDNTAISMPMRNLLSILVAVAAGVWAYSEITTRLTFLETSKQLMEQDLLEASTQKPIDQEQFMMLEDLYKSTEKLVERVDGMMHNQVNIERLEKDMEKAQRDVEKLKDNLRNFANGNGAH
jgi:succinate dehydrogenase/fumarate reductase flavoprotein subunit